MLREHRAAVRCTFLSIISGLLNKESPRNLWVRSGGGNSHIVPKHWKEVKWPLSWGMKEHRATGNIINHKVREKYLFVLLS